MSYLDKGHTLKETGMMFEVGIATIARWKKRRAETGTVEKSPLQRKNTKVCPDRLIAYITKRPDSYLSEIAKELNCTPQAVFYALKRLKITRKKNG